MNHCAGDGERSATVIGFAHEIPLQSGGMTSQTGAKLIGHLGGSPASNFCSILGHVEHEELPIQRFTIEALVSLDHSLVRNQLKNRSRWIHGLDRRIGGGQGRVEVAS